MTQLTNNQVTLVGKISTVYGVKGWVKIYSYTDPMENILSYSPWLIKVQGTWKQVKLEAGKRHGKGLIAKIEGIDDREIAKTYNGVEIGVSEDALPKLDDGEYYWSQLENLNVVTVEGQLLGTVSHLMETGANDVLVVKGNAQSIDKAERLIPYLPEQVITEIDLVTGTIRVDWDPEF